MRQLSNFTAWHFSKSRREAREKLESNWKVRKFDKDKNSLQDELADHIQGGIGSTGKNYDHVTDGIIYGLKYNVFVIRKKKQKR